MILLALALCLLTADDDKPITIPPAGVVIPPAKPGDPPLHLTVPFNPNAADKADLEALAKRVDALAESLARLTRLQATPPKAEDCESICTKAAIPLPKAITSQCPETCRCPFPGACGHPGCACKFVSGWRPRDEWRPFTANPTWEVFGHEVDGVFRYTASRRVVRQAPALCPNGGCSR